MNEKECQLGIYHLYPFEDKTDLFKRESFCFLKHNVGQQQRRFSHCLCVCERKYFSLYIRKIVPD